MNLHYVNLGYTNQILSTRILPIEIEFWRNMGRWSCRTNPGVLDEDDLVKMTFAYRWCTNDASSHPIKFYGILSPDFLEFSSVKCLIDLVDLYDWRIYSLVEYFLTYWISSLNIFRWLWNWNRCATRLYSRRPLLFIIYMNDIHTVSDNLNFILYADDSTLSCPMCSFRRECNGDIGLVRILINSELNKITDWHAVNKLSPKDYNGKWYTTCYDKQHLDWTGNRV